MYKEIKATVFKLDERYKSTNLGILTNLKWSKLKGNYTTVHYNQNAKN